MSCANIHFDFLRETTKRAVAEQDFVRIGTNPKIVQVYLLVLSEKSLSNKKYSYNELRWNSGPAISIIVWFSMNHNEYFNPYIPKLRRAEYQ